MGIFKTIYKRLAIRQAHKEKVNKTKILKGVFECYFVKNENNKTNHYD